MWERLFGGYDIDPSSATLDSTYFYFNFAFIVHRLGMIVLGYLLLMGRKQVVLARGLAVSLTLFEIIFFTNPFVQTSDTERANM